MNHNNFEKTAGLVAVGRPVEVSDLAGREFHPAVQTGMELSFGRSAGFLIAHAAQEAAQRESVTAEPAARSSRFNLGEAAVQSA